MPYAPPVLNLTHGQVAWAIAHGQEPSQELLDRLTYLRRLGIPFKGSEQGKGRGNALRYSTEQLIETGIGAYALRQRVRPKDIAQMLVEDRQAHYRVYRDALSEIPPGAYTASWIHSKGREIPILDDDIYIALRDRHTGERCKFERMDPDMKNLQHTFGQVIARYGDGKTVPAVPLKRLIIELVGLAKDAPEIKAGRR